MSSKIRENTGMVSLGKILKSMKVVDCRVLRNPIYPNNLSGENACKISCFSLEKACYIVYNYIRRSCF